MKKTALFIFFILFSVSLMAAQQGVVVHDKKKTDDCYRLISSRNLSAAHVLRSDGRYVHSWHLQPTEEATSDFSGFGMTWHYAEMLPNGHLIAIIKDEKIIELDWHSSVVWQAKLRAHHDFTRTASGHTIVVSRRDVDDPWKPGKKIAMDELVEFDAEGNRIWHWQYEKHLDEIAALSPQPLPPDAGFRDWPHINTCEVLPDNPSAEKDARFRAGNLLLCGRHSNTIFIIDRDSDAVVWAWGHGELQGPHMPTMLPSGNILIYDNGNHLKSTSRGFTRVIELNPLNGKIVWDYSADPKESFFSPSRGSANRLANGNTLIANSDNGHLFETTSSGEVVWEYWNSDIRESGRRMPLYRVIPYEKKQIDALLLKHGVVKDVLPDYQENLTFEKLGPDHQYKRYLREVVFYAELGYFDHALNFLDQFMQVFPNDPEGFYGYAAVHSAKKNPDKAYEYMVKAIDAGLPLDRFTCGLGHILQPLQNSEAYQNYVSKQDASLVHGPMLGDVTATSAKIWLRTLDERDVQIQARKKGDLDFHIRSTKIKSNALLENTAIIELFQLSPNCSYDYRLAIDGIVHKDIYDFTTAPKKGESAQFSLGFGGGAGATPKYEYMWDTIRSHDLPLFLLLGDNVYIDHPERPLTQQFCYYRRQSRPEFRRFTPGTAVYAIWDDHDFTFNDGKGSPEVDEPAWKKDVWRVFKNQWVNPAYGSGKKQPGCWFNFSYGDVDFFMLDCRYYREQPKGNPAASMLGTAQKKWLFDELKKSSATFKVIASSVPWAEGTKPGSLDTWDGHPREREEIFSFIEKNRVEGIVLISADRHRSDAWKINRPKGYNFYDFESSKISNIHTHQVMPSSLFGYNKKCSFGRLDFDTTANDPRVTYRIFSIDNEEIHRLTLYKSDLSFNQK